VQYLRTWKWILLALSVSFCTATQAKLPERLSLDQGWLFHLGEVEQPTDTGHGMSYHNGKANGTWGTARPEVNVLVEAAPGQPSGLWGRVVLEPGQR
jgi:hypothetical protein